MYLFLVSLWVVGVVLTFSLILFLNKSYFGKVKIELKIALSYILTSWVGLVLVLSVIVKDDLLEFLKFLKSRPNLKNIKKYFEDDYVIN